MKVNGYEIGAEPTKEEFATYRKVSEFLDRESVAWWFYMFDEDDKLTQDEFEDLADRFHHADFREENSSFIEYEYCEIMEEGDAA